MKFMRGRLLVCFALFAVLPMAAVNAHGGGELEKEMKRVNRAFKQVRESGDPAIIGENFEKMLRHAKKIESQMLPRDADAEDEEDFRSGMKELIDLIEEGVVAAAENDSAAVAAVIKRLRKVEKEYHDRFDVED